MKQHQILLLNQNQNCENVNNMELTSFQDAYVERCDKETENVIAVEDPNFFNEKISYFKEHKNEYMYLESEHFEAINTIYENFRKSNKEISFKIESKEDDYFEKLKKLKELFDLEIISLEEYEEKKKKIIDNI